MSRNERKKREKQIIEKFQHITGMIVMIASLLFWASMWILNRLL